MLQQFGGRIEGNFDITKATAAGETHRISLARLEIPIPFLGSWNLSAAPEAMTIKDINQFIELLNTLGVRYQREAGALKIAERQRRSWATPETLTAGYQWARKQDYMPSLTSSRPNSTVSVTETIEHDRQGKKYLRRQIKFGKDGNRTRKMEIKPETIYATQEFLETNLGIQLGGRFWEASRYKMLDQKKDENIIQIKD